VEQCHPVSMPRNPRPPPSGSGARLVFPSSEGLGNINLEVPELDRHNSQCLQVGGSRVTLQAASLHLPDSYRVVCKWLRHPVSFLP
jgi:hypothetical protein